MKDEDHVRNYVTFLRTPEALIDQARVDDLSARLDEETDAVERLRLHSARQQAAHVDEDTLRAAFEGSVKRWADAAGISAEALSAEGVPVEVLRAAGFKVGKQRRRRGTGPRTSAADVVTHVGALKGGTTLTVKSLCEATSASTATTRKAVGQSVEDGLLVEVGVDEGHEGPGRAPLVYRRLTKAETKARAAA